MCQAHKNDIETCPRWSFVRPNIEMPKSKIENAKIENSKNPRLLSEESAEHPTLPLPVRGRCPSLISTPTFPRLPLALYSLLSRVCSSDLTLLSKLIHLRSTLLFTVPTTLCVGKHSSNLNNFGRAKRCSRVANISYFLTSMLTLNICLWTIFQLLSKLFSYDATPNVTDSSLKIHNKSASYHWTC